MLRCYLDTNVLIHYKRFNTLDWHSILETSEEVTLVVAPIVLSELNKKKDTDQNKGIRTRAGDILKEFDKYHENGTISEGIFLNFVCIEPQIDWNLKGLDPGVSDDRLIASMILEKDTSNLVLVTSDFGLKLKARNKNIKIVKLDDSLKVDVRLDAETKKIKELEGKLARYENASPKLELYVKDSADSKFHEFEYIRVPAADSVVIEAKIEKLRRELESKKPQKSNGNRGIGIISGFGNVSETEIDRYERAIDEYLIKLREYYSNLNHYENYKSRLFSLELVLSNAGEKVASDIDIFLHFPDGFKMLNEDDASDFEEPISPKRPYPPRTTQEILSTGFLSSYPDIFASSIPDFGHINIPSRLGVDCFLVNIEKTHSYDVHFQVQRLKQNMEMALDSIFLLFDSYEDIKSFSFEYVINVENHPDEFRGEYHIKFKPVE